MMGAKLLGIHFAWLKFWNYVSSSCQLPRLGCCTGYWSLLWMCVSSTCSGGLVSTSTACVYALRICCGCTVRFCIHFSLFRGRVCTLIRDCCGKCCFCGGETGLFSYCLWVGWRYMYSFVVFLSGLVLDMWHCLACDITWSTKTW